MSRRRNKHGGGGHEGGDERWLLTYADMITLLLALFIILFAMSTIDARKFDAVKRSLSQSFHGQVFDGNNQVMDGSQSVLDPSASSALPNSTAFTMQQDAQDRNKTRFAREQQKLEKLTKDSKVKGVSVTSIERGIVVSLAGDSFFASGSAALRPEVETFLAGLADELIAARSHVAIEGHTDGQPISTVQFPDNWALSGARASAVLRYLESNGVNRNHMRYTGYADTKPVRRPSQPNQSIAKNRRVEVVILAPASDRNEAQQLGQASSAGARASAAPLNPIGDPIATPRQRPQTEEIDLIGQVIGISQE